MGNKSWESTDGIPVCSVVTVELGEERARVTQKNVEAYYAYDNTRVDTSAKLTLTKTGSIAHQDVPGVKPFVAFLFTSTVYGEAYSLKFNHRTVHDQQVHRTGGIVEEF
jgi:hypothetical protein